MEKQDKEFDLLKNISNEYLNPDKGRQVDQKILGLVVNEMLPWINGPSVLEMGFGDDQWTSKIIEKIGSTSIVDASEDLLAQAKKKYGDTVQTYSSFFEVFKPEKKYDTILASYILEHVHNPVEVLLQANSWLQPTGKIIAIVPNAGSFHRHLAVQMGISKSINELGYTDIQMGHRRVYTFEEFERDIEAANLKIVSSRGLFVKFLPQNQMTELSDEQLTGFMKLSSVVPKENCVAIAILCEKK